MAGPDPLQVQCSLPVVPGKLTGLEDSPCPVPSRPGGGALRSSALHMGSFFILFLQGVLMCLPSDLPWRAPQCRLGRPGPETC